MVDKKGGTGAYELPKSDVETEGLEKARNSFSKVKKLEDKVKKKRKKRKKLRQKMLTEGFVLQADKFTITAGDEVVFEWTGKMDIGLFLKIMKSYGLN